MIFLNKLFLTILLSILLSISFVINAKTDNNLTEKELTTKIENLVKILQYVDAVYVDEVDKQDMIDNAINGMLESLDPHSAYLKPKEQKNLMESSSGKFGGLGIVINKKDDLIEVVSPIDDTPAHRAGLKSGDLIIKIGDKAVRGMSLEDGVKLMRGTPTTSVNLTIFRKGEKPFKVDIIRDIITVVSAKGHLLDKDLGYLRISSFQEPTKNLVVKNINKLIKQNQGNNLKSLIIDLRNNPGGLLTSAVDISNLFIDNKELIVYTKGKLQNQFSEFFATKGDITGGAKIVVLINEGSASASEIVSGAIQDHRRGLIVGKKSFGKGSVQTVIPINNGYGLKITTAKYYTPNGTSIQATGITPDIELENIEFKVKDEEDISIKESDLENHLDNIDNKKDLGGNKASDKNTKNDDDKKIAELKEDYFIYEAINLLKVLNIVDNR